jgi:hypothetical protein
MPVSVFTVINQHGHSLIFTQVISWNLDMTPYASNVIKRLLMCNISSSLLQSVLNSYPPNSVAVQRIAFGCPSE